MVLPKTPPSSFYDLGLEPGVLSPEDFRKLNQHAHDTGYEIQAYHCAHSAACNAAMEAGRNAGGAPVVIRVNYAGSLEYSGTNNPGATVSGAIALALHVRTLAPHYGVPVVLQSETRCLERLGTWYEELTRANEAYYKAYQQPLFSSHRLDLNADYPSNTDGCRKEILSIASKYLRRLQPLEVWLDIVLVGHCCQGKEGMVLGGKHRRPKDISPKVWSAYQSLPEVSSDFSLVLQRAGTTSHKRVPFESSGVPTDAGVGSS